MTETTGISSLPDSVQREADELLEKLRIAASREKLYLWCAPEPSDTFDAESPHLYRWQADFMESSRDYVRRCLMAANRVGKSMTVSAEMAMHLVGWYPDWWEGRRFQKPISLWVGSTTNLASRDIVQRSLLGQQGEYGTGWIPGDMIHSDGPSMRQCGVQGVADSVRVKHASGGWSWLQFLTYEQGWEKWQGTAQDIVWFDEEPPELVFNEGMTRTIDKNGMTVLSFTPLQGYGEVVMTFLEPREGSRPYVQTVTWDQAYHLDEKGRAELLATFPEHLRDAKTKGVPTIGSGAIYPVADEKIVCDPFPIPPFYRRICGIDFGIDHPFAAVWLAHDTDRDIVYVYDEYRVESQTPLQHVPAINSRGRWIPVAWPHDGVTREKGSGQQLSERYLEQEANLLGVSARYRDDKGGAQPTEPVVYDVLERMKTGRFKVFTSCRNWLSEKRLYHRDDHGRIVRKRDDLMSAGNYAMMMLRYAVSEMQGSGKSRRQETTGVSGYDPFEPIGRRDSNPPVPELYY